MSDSDEQLRLHIEAIETLEEEKKGVSEDIKDRFGLAKGEGFDVTAMKAVIRRRKLEREEREQLDGIIETYEASLADQSGE